MSMISQQGAEDLAKDLERLAESLISDELLHLAGLAAIRRIQQRRRKGVDVRGRLFEPYSEGHAKKRRLAGLPTSPVDLKFDQYDSMSDAIDHITSPDLATVEVLFTNPRAAQLAQWHNVDGAGRSKIVREFFGLNDQDERALTKLIGDEVGRIISLSNLA